MESAKPVFYGQCYSALCNRPACNLRSCCFTPLFCCAFNLLSPFPESQFSLGSNTGEKLVYLSPLVSFPGHLQPRTPSRSWLLRNFDGVGACREILIAIIGHALATELKKLTMVGILVEMELLDIKAGRGDCYRCCDV